MSLVNMKMLKSYAVPYTPLASCSRFGLQYEALRRVHLIPSGSTEAEDTEENLATVNANVFRNLDLRVSEGGENFSTG